MLRRALVYGVAAVTIPLTALCGQVLRGVVVDPSDLPIPGVVVTLLDTAATEAARALTGDRGDFRVRVPAPGTYRLRALRIGFRPVLSDPIVIGSAAEVVRRIELASLPLTLAAVRIEARSSCRVATDSASATFGALEQARAALTAADLAASARTLTITTVVYARTLDTAAPTRVLDQTATVSREFVRQPWRAISLDSARRVGYMAIEPDGTTTYSAPGLDGLSSQAFLADHCFNIVPGADRSTLGIAFTPAPARLRTRLPELRGTLWLDRATAALRRLEFGYVNVTPLQARYASGTMEFARLPTATWVVTQWSLRLPALEARARRTTPRGAPVLDTVVTALRQFGGTLVLATRGTDTLWAGSPMIVSGVVVDSLDGTPVARGRVLLAGTSRAAETDAQGRFALAGVLPGRYRLDVRTPSLDSLAAAHRVTLDLVEGSGPLVLRVPQLTQLLGALCPGSGSALRGGLLVGTVRLSADSLRPPPATRVIAEWSTRGNSAEVTLAAAHAADSAAAAGEPNQHRVSVRVDSAGTFRTCGVPSAQRLLVRAETDSGLYAEPTVVQLAPGARVASVQLLLDATKAVLARFEGVVVAESARQPLEGAEVMLVDTDRSTTTDARGRFQLLGVTPGTHHVRVRRLGYGPLDTTLVFAANRTLDRSIVLARVQTLDSLTVVGTRPGLPVSFLDHQKIGLGHFLTREELAKQQERRMGDVLRSLPGIKVIDGTGNRAWIASSRGIKSISKPCTNEHREFEGKSRLDARRCECVADVYLDGVIVSKTVVPDVNRFQIERLEAIEYYAGPAQTPPEYAGLGSQCGVLVLWTRRSP